MAGILPGVARQLMKKLGPDEDALLALICRWKDEASRAGRNMMRVCVAYEAGRDGFWLARWLLAHGIETYVIHAANRRRQASPSTTSPSSAHHDPSGRAWRACPATLRECGLP